MEQTINRFASTLSGAFKAFHLYRQDNKALDEIMQNLLSRFQTAAQTKPVIKLGITNRSLVFEGDPIGAHELTRHMALMLRSLGFKEIIFKAPLQARHFFQLLNILSSKDPIEVKLEKFLPLIGDDDEKPVTLVPITANSLLLRMADELLERRLASVSFPFAQTQIESLPDLYTWICVKAEGLEKSVRSFVRNLTDATREGYFPWERFLKVFPLPLPLKQNLFLKLTASHTPRPRAQTALGLGFKSFKKRAKEPPLEWASWAVAFSSEELKNRLDLSMTAGQHSGLQDLELAESLLNESGSNFLLGFRFLLRALGHQSSVAIQEKALKLGISVWIKAQALQEDMNVMSLLSTLRQNLTAPHNMSLTLFPLRSLTIESEMFGKLTQYISSLGEAALPSLIQILDVESDRGMRRKLCHVITLIARHRGVEFLIESLSAASPFLTRNVLMILGDVRSPQAVPILSQLLTSPQKMIRVEAARSLGKIGSTGAIQALKQAQRSASDKEEQDSIGIILSRFPS